MRSVTNEYHCNSNYFDLYQFYMWFYYFSEFLSWTPYQIKCIFHISPCPRTCTSQFWQEWQENHNAHVRDSQLLSPTETHRRKVSLSENRVVCEPSQWADCCYGYLAIQIYRFHVKMNTILSTLSAFGTRLKIIQIVFQTKVETLRHD